MGIDLESHANEYTPWTPFPGRMAHCGSRRTIDAADRLTDQLVALRPPLSIELLVVQNRRGNHGNYGNYGNYGNVDSVS